MKPGQVLTKWWQDYVAGRLRTPQSLMDAVRRENPDKLENRFTEAPEDGPVWAAPKRLAAPAFIKTEGYIRQCFRADWQQTDVRLRLWAARLCIRARDQGIPLYIHSAFRTREQQSDLLRRGVTKVGWPRSAHNIGEAVDIVHGVYHWDLTQDEWLYIHHLGMDELRKLNATLRKRDRLALNWGGDDTTPGDTFRWDPAHWEIADYRERIRQIEPGVPRMASPALIVKGKGSIPGTVDYEALGL